MASKGIGARDRDEEVVGELTGGVLHEFNNVLQGIIGLAEMLDADSSLPEKARIGMKAIKRLGQNAAQIVQSIGGESEVAEGESEDSSQAFAAAAAVEPPKKKFSVLIAEDDKLVLNALLGMLKHLGYRTIGVRNGIEALEKYNQDPSQIGVVITDLEMPKMNGLQLTKELLALDPDLKVVIMTGYLQEEIDFKIDELGLAGWLEKPMSASGLSHLIDKLMPE